MATHYSILAWKSPWTEEPGRLQSMGLRDWARMCEEGGKRWVGNNKLIEQKQKQKQTNKKPDRLQLSSPQADRCLLDRNSQDMGAGWHQSSHPKDPPWLPFLYFPSPCFGCALCKTGLAPTTSQWKGRQMGICSRLIDNRKLYNSRFLLCMSSHN